ncbi:hypothetical protein HDV02_005063 [Globomyces sp. JEL0801]|nr:hypothetical protein HDV02_005063 [Globomyces sp. JEL0801]
MGDPRNWKGHSSEFKNRVSNLFGIVPHTVIWEGSKPKPNQKILFVANHQVGALELPLIWSVIWLQTGIWPRGLMDRLRNLEVVVNLLDFVFPIWSHILWFMGGSRETCEQAMTEGYPIFVLPGGGDEVMRSKYCKKYELLWKDRKGFAVMANYTIVPVSSIGVEDMMTILMDIPVGWFLKFTGDKRVSQTVPLICPNFSFQRQYIKFGKPIKTAKGDDTQEIRDKAFAAVSSGIKELQEKQSTDPKRYYNIFTFFFKDHKKED